MEGYGYSFGSILDAFTYIREKGISLKKRYPSNSFRSNRCIEQMQRPIYVGIKSIDRLTPGDEENLKKTVCMFGPIVAKIYVTGNFMGYSSGIFYDTTCFATRVTNHAVLVVGYGTDPSGADFWILKNSWIPYWGENGYMKMARNTEFNCGITSSAFFLSIDGLIG